MLTDINGKPIGMKWYKFLIHFALFIGSLLNFLQSFKYLTGSMYLEQGVTAEMVYAYYGEFLKVVDIMYGLFLIAISIMGLVLRHKLANYKPGADIFAYIFYSLAFGGSLMYSLLVADIISAPIGSEMIGSLIGYGIFLALTIRYLNRRAHLFVGTPPCESCPSDEKASEQPLISSVEDTNAAAPAEENTVLSNEVQPINTDADSAPPLCRESDSPKKEKNETKYSLTEKIIFVICGVLLFVLLSVIILAGISLAEKDSKKASDTIEDTLELISVAIPENGEVITGKEWRCASYITIKNIGDKNGYFVLVNSNQEPFYSFFVRNHQIATVPVPNGSYYITCYLGDVGEEWYGKDYLFGNASADCKSEMMNLNNSTWEYNVNNNIASQKYASPTPQPKETTPAIEATTPAETIKAPEKTEAPETESPPKQNIVYLPKQNYGNNKTNVSGVSENKTQATEIKTYYYTASTSFADIPKYSGKIYVTLNNNTPKFEKDFSMKETSSYSPLDKKGRCGAAFACLGPNGLSKGVRESNVDYNPTGWHSVEYSGIEENYLYNRCHLIGLQFTDESDNYRNLITGTRELNVKGMLPFENKIAKYIESTGNHVLYRVTPIYTQNNLLADGVQLEAFSVEDKGKGICFNVFCYNVQPNVEIDYSTGNSYSSIYSLIVRTAEKKEEASHTTPTYEPVKTNGYVLNKKSKKFHFPECHSAKKINPEHRGVYNGSRKSLIAQGYSPCGNCDP